MIKLSILSIFLCLVSCNSSSPTSNFEQREWQEFAARDFGSSLERPLIYRALVPNNWIRKDLPSSISIADTIKPICEFSIEEGQENIRLTIHTFPISDSYSRIPPKAQIDRWQKQFDEFNPHLTMITPVSHGGYFGLYLETQGLYQEIPTMMLAWSMQLAPEHERKLSLNRQELDKYKRADYTIKALGALHLMEKHQRDIEQFANSFELIEELPN